MTEQYSQSTEAWLEEQRVASGGAAGVLANWARFVAWEDRQINARRAEQLAEIQAHREDLVTGMQMRGEQAETLQEKMRRWAAQEEIANKSEEWERRRVAREASDAFVVKAEQRARQAAAELAERARSRSNEAAVKARLADQTRPADRARPVSYRGAKNYWE